MNYSDAIGFLYGLRLHGLKLGLDNTRALAAMAGDPQKRLRFIHVAGTNGKGSTCAMLEAIYRRAGYRVGLFTSPHLVSFRERMQVNREWIGEGAVVRLAMAMRGWIGAFPAEHCPTFFEVITVMALLHFVDQDCDLVIWETGMGGRLDATNIVLPEASVITSIHLDHMRWLGATLSEIAVEKAGIIKRGVPVVSAAQDSTVLDVLRARAEELASSLTVVDPQVEGCGLPPGWDCALPGLHQRANAALSVATARALRRRIPVEDEAIQLGLSGVEWPGRMQVVTAQGGGRLLLDGAHNPSGIQALVDGMRHAFPAESPVFIIGMLQDKDWGAMAVRLARCARRILVVPVRSDRGLAPESLAEACRLPGQAAADVQVAPSLAAALQSFEAEPFVVVTGSLYLVGEAMALLDLLPGASVDELDLNDWAPGANP
jgi:dihydrofolate synthase/folylpolyglutamate synthase